MNARRFFCCRILHNLSQATGSGSAHHTGFAHGCSLQSHNTKRLIEAGKYAQIRESVVEPFLLIIQKVCHQSYVTLFRQFSSGPGLQAAFTYYQQLHPRVLCQNMRHRRKQLPDAFNRLQTSYE